MSEDDDIARAIALSLQESAASSRAASGPPATNHDDEAQFQAELERAIAASKAESSHAKASSSRKPLPRTSSPDVVEISDSESKPDEDSVSPPTQVSRPEPVSTSTSAFLSERAQLEQARLARQKRLRGEDADSAASSSRGVSREAGPPRKKQVPAAGIASRSAGGSGSARMDGLFWEGELRQTANIHVPGKNGEDGRPVWRLSEIIGDKSEISLAIISSYALQLSWIYQFFLPSTPVVLAAHPAQTESTRPTVKEVLPNWIRVTPALRGGFGTQHMKFMLLFYKTGRLRIVISTANLVEFDWRDIENTAWVQDVPKYEKPISHDPRATDFPAVFERVLNALHVGAGLSSLVRNEFPSLPFPAAHPGALRTRYDFSRVKARLIVSIVGKHEGWPSVLGVGHMALMKAVREIGAESKKTNPVTIECQGSSVGTYSTQWMNEFYGSAAGESPEKWLDEPKSRRTKLPWPPVKILFPTLQYVRASVAGEAGGGTIFCRRKQWEATRFPRELFYESRSKRGRILMHTKMIIATLEKPNIVEVDGNASSSPETSDTETEPESDDGLVITGDPQGKGKVKKIYGWAYVGSHNFTPSAWGTLSGSGFSPVLNISNYEIGIVLPLHSAAEVEKVACFERPPRKYGKDDLPWMQEESAICQGGD